MKHKVHHDNQLTELFLMICISPTALQKNTHTELLFSLLTLSTAFLVGWEKTISIRLTELL